MDKVRKILAGSLILMLFAAGLVILFQSQQSFSENENRSLAELPDFSLSGFMDGSFQEDLSDALSDQFPGRDFLMKLGTKIKLLTGRKDIGDAYIGKDHYFFEKVTDADIDLENFEKNIRRIDKLAGDYPDLKCRLMLVPSSGVIMSELLPDYAQVYDAQALFDKAACELTGVSLVDPTKWLLSEKQSGKQIYYRTDHHWTSDGAWAGYEALTGGKGAYSGEMGEPVTEDFLGTLYSRTLDDSAVPDSISLPEVSGSVTVTADGKDGSLYSMEALKEKDKYKVFQGGNFGLAEITGTGSGTLMIIKDSFANSLVPYLTADYAKIIMIDLRYFPGSVRSLLDQEDAEEILFLYEMNNFASDTGLAKLSL